MHRPRLSNPIRSALTLICIAAAGCATHMPVGQDVVRPTREFAEFIALPYVTNRRLESAANNRSYFGGHTGPLAAGYCMVGIDDGKAKLLRIAMETPPEVLSLIGRDQPHGVVVYVHGYNEGFDRSCRRAALLRTNLKLDGRLILFSWPADGNVTAYSRDVADLGSSLDDLLDVLSELADRHGTGNIDIVAHSLGARGVVEALARDAGAASTERFGRLVLIAPDIDRQRFLESVEALRSRVSDVTVYASRRDRVLRLSSAVNHAERLGVAEDFRVDADRVEIVDITPAGDPGITGHLYHLHNAAVIEDLRRLLGTSGAGEAARFERRPAGTPAFWTLQPSGSPD